MDQTERNLSALSYITILGWLISYILAEKKSSPFISFHSRQSLGLHIFLVLNTLLILKISFFLYLIILVGLVLLWFIGFGGAMANDFKKIPLLGDQFQDWFKFID